LATLRQGMAIKRRPLGVFLACNCYPDCKNTRRWWKAHHRCASRTNRSEKNWPTCESGLVKSTALRPIYRLHGYPKCGQPHPGRQCRSATKANSCAVQLRPRRTPSNFLRLLTLSGLLFHHAESTDSLRGPECVEFIVEKNQNWIKCHLSRGCDWKSYYRAQPSRKFVGRRWAQNLTSR